MLTTFRQSNFSQEFPAILIANPDRACLGIAIPSIAGLRLTSNFMYLMDECTIMDNDYHFLLTRETDVNHSNV